MCSEKQKVTIQFHRGVGVGVRGQTEQRENRQCWWENSICGVATQRYRLGLMMEGGEAVQKPRSYQNNEKVGKKNVLRHYYICKCRAHPRVHEQVLDVCVLSFCSVK